MSEETTTTTEVADQFPGAGKLIEDDTTEDGVDQIDPAESTDLKSDQDRDLKSQSDPETFPREAVEDLRKENAKYRKRAGQADELAQRLHTELVRATGRLADPSDLPFDEDHLADAVKMVAAIDELLDAKPHLATRKPSGDVGQGNRGGAPQPVSLLQMLRERA